jgi:anti-anti-sigma factor
MPEEFSVEESPLFEYAVALRVTGQLNARSTPLLVEKTREVRDRGRHLVLNLSRVTFIASSGIGGLLALVEEYREAGLTVRLADLSQPVVSVIKLLNLDQFLTIDVDEDESRNALEAA